MNFTFSELSSEGGHGEFQLFVLQLASPRLKSRNKCRLRTGEREIVLDTMATLGYDNGRKAKRKE